MKKRTVEVKMFTVGSVSEDLSQVRLEEWANSVLARYLRVFNHDFCDTP